NLRRRFRVGFWSDLHLVSRVVWPLGFGHRDRRGRRLVRRRLRCPSLSGPSCARGGGFEIVVIAAEQPGEDPQRQFGDFDSDAEPEPCGSDAEAYRRQWVERHWLVVPGLAGIKTRRPVG